MTAATELAPVVKSIEVATTPEKAFRVFTEQLDTWWPIPSHSIGEGEVESVVVEGRVGGRIVERWNDGTTYEWGRITAWDPPNRLVMDWRPNPEPGPYTEVEVTFTRHGDATLVELQHRGWERLGAVAAEARESYDSGWVPVLAAYEAAATR